MANGSPFAQPLPLRTSHGHGGGRRPAGLGEGRPVEGNVELRDGCVLRHAPATSPERGGGLSLRGGEDYPLPNIVTFAIENERTRNTEKKNKSGQPGNSNWSHGYLSVNVKKKAESFSKLTRFPQGQRPGTLPPCPHPLEGVTE